MNATKFLSTVGRHVARPGDRHYMAGWVNTPCPFCEGSHPGNHLGHDGKEPWVCWRCGPHSSVEVVKTLLDLSSWHEARKAVREFSRGGSPAPREKERPKTGVRPQAGNLPRGARSLQKRHKDYLSSRGYAPEEIASVWGLLGTGPAGQPPLRIVAPIRFKGQIVSWQARDITGKAEKKYLACPKSEEGMDHHATLYGIDKASEQCILVEGITDVWRLGPGAVASFGQKVVPAQIKLLAGFDRVAIFLDSDAARSAEAVGNTLSLLGVETELWTPEKGTDPADLDEKEVQSLWQRFFRKER